jgi:hypothetical protein
MYYLYHTVINFLEKNQRIINVLKFGNTSYMSFFIKKGFIFIAYW